MALWWRDSPFTNPHREDRAMSDPDRIARNFAVMEAMTRRALLLGGSSVALVAALWWAHSPDADAATATFEVTKTDDEWRHLLKPATYQVMRRHGTERPFSSPLDHEKRKGIFACAACDLPLYSSETKFDSGTGWPSFYRPLPNAVGESTDRSMILPRTEIHCRRCGGHLGHVFNDGPPPTGLRYCMNGVALTFKPAAPGAA
jgi:peptide-methionine (R)-S-oxide reductase